LTNPLARSQHEKAKGDDQGMREKPWGLKALGLAEVEDKPKSHRMRAL
jgi:hypothetical protein